MCVWEHDESIMRAFPQPQACGLTGFTLTVNRAKCWQSRTHYVRWPHKTGALVKVSHAHCRLSVTNTHRLSTFIRHNHPLRFHISCFSSLSPPHLHLQWPCFPRSPTEGGCESPETHPETMNGNGTVAEYICHHWKRENEMKRYMDGWRSTI